MQFGGGLVEAMNTSQVTWTENRQMGAVCLRYVLLGLG